MSGMTEVQVLEGALAAFAEEGFSSGTYWPDGSGSPADGYCAMGGLVKAAGGGHYDCYTDYDGNRRELFLAAHPGVVRAHARLEANLGLSVDDLLERSVLGDGAVERLEGAYGGSLLEFWVEECLPGPAAVIALFERTLAEARVVEATQSAAMEAVV